MVILRDRPRQSLQQQNWLKKRGKSMGEPTRRAECRNTDRELQQWRKPIYGVVKINCDAAWLSATRKERTRVVARDWEGTIISNWNKVGSDTSAKKMEANDIFHAVELTIAYKWEKVTMKSDAQHIINQLNGMKEGPNWELRNIHTDIIEMAEQIPTIHNGNT